MEVLARGCWCEKETAPPGFGGRCRLRMGGCYCFFRVCCRGFRLRRRLGRGCRISSIMGLPFGLKTDFASFQAVFAGLLMWWVILLLKISVSIIKVLYIAFNRKIIVGENSVAFRFIRLCGVMLLLIADIVNKARKVRRAY